MGILGLVGQNNYYGGFMFLTVVFGILKFFGLALGVAIFIFLINVLKMILSGNGGNVKLGKGYYLLGLFASIAYHLIKYSL